MRTDKTIAEIELENQFNTLKKMFRAHLDGYIAHVKATLNAKTEDLITDYTNDDTGELSIPVEVFRSAMTSGRHSLTDCIEAFWDHEGDSPFVSYDDLETELNRIEVDLNGHLKDTDSEEHTSTHEDLAHYAERYRLSKSQYYQDEILKILENEYDLTLIVAPADNQ